MSTCTTDKTAIEMREKDKKVLALRRAGYTFQQISEALGMSVSGAHKCARRSIEQIPKEEAILVRDMELIRLDYAFQKIWKMLDKAKKPLHATRLVNSLIAIMAKRSKYLDLENIKIDNFSNMSDVDLKKKAIELLGGNPDDQNKEDNPST